MTDAKIEVLDDPAAELAARLAAAAGAAATIVLTGGSTPRLAYQKAAALDADWKRARFWFGDERCVPPGSEHSNYAMAERALLGRIDAAEVHRMPGELGPQRGAASYEEELRGSLGDEPRFDLLLLGLGPDAHTASLYPNDPALGERERVVVGVEMPGMAPLVPRVTLTLPVLNRAREIVFLVAGEDKAPAVARSFAGRRGPDAPASLVEPEDGSLTVLLDAAAASRLDRD
jgi:6-phosphogluconolactonase